jgi:hypothetical protein
VRHPGAEEPVVRRGILVSDRVRPDPQIAAVEIVGNRSGDLEVERGDLLADRRVIAVEVRVFGLTNGGCGGHSAVSFRSIAIGIPVSNQ